MQDAKNFLAEWVTENAHPEGYEPEGDDTRARDLAGACGEDASKEGLSARDLDIAARDMIGGGDDLVTFVAHALEGATDAEIRRLAEKDG